MEDTDPSSRRFGSPMAKLFFSYAHEDEAHRDELEKHLASLKDQGLIECWHDRRLTPGTDFAVAIDGHLVEADVVLLLVSSSFLASKYCHGIEMQRALDRRKAGECIVVPVVVRPCDWKRLGRVFSGSQRTRQRSPGRLQLQVQRWQVRRSRASQLRGPAIYPDSIRSDLCRHQPCEQRARRKHAGCDGNGGAPFATLHFSRGLARLGDPSGLV